LAGIESLVIGADHDAAGVAAAEACATRWVGAGREVFVAVPDVEHADLNDLMMAA
jgi:hypothetical protein